MDIGNVIVIPTPTAEPLIAPIVGFEHLCIANATRPPPSRWFFVVSALFVASALRRKPMSKSAPAQNILPYPVRTMHFIRLSTLKRV